MPNTCGRSSMHNSVSKAHVPDSPLECRRPQLCKGSVACRQTKRSPQAGFSERPYGAPCERNQWPARRGNDRDPKNKIANRKEHPSVSQLNTLRPGKNPSAPGHRGFSGHQARILGLGFFGASLAAGVPVSVGVNRQLQVRAGACSRTVHQRKEVAKPPAPRASLSTRLKLLGTQTRQSPHSSSGISRAAGSLVVVLGLSIFFQLGTPRNVFCLGFGVLLPGL